MMNADIPAAVERRRRVFAMLIAGPALLASITISGVELWRWYRPASSLFVAPPVTSLADAIQTDDFEAAHVLVPEADGLDGRIAVNHPVLTGGRTVHVAPLVWAAANQSDRTVAMLLGHGPPVDVETKRRALCIAEALGNTVITGALRPYVDEGCAAMPSSDMPLLQ